MGAQLNPYESLFFGRRIQPFIIGEVVGVAFQELSVPHLDHSHRPTNDAGSWVWRFRACLEDPCWTTGRKAMDAVMSSRVFPDDDDERVDAESPVSVNNNDGDTSNSSCNNNIFKQCHNYHKRHPHHPDRLDDLDELLDFRRCSNDPQNNDNKFAPYIRHIDVDHRAMYESGRTAAAVDADDDEEVGMDPQEPQRQRRPGEDFGIRCFGLSCYPGFLFFPAALDDDDETLIRRLAYCALTEYCEGPYRTNIEQIAPKSSEIVLPIDDVTAAIATASTSRTSSMWDLWVQQQEEQQELAEADERTTSSATKHRPPPPPPSPRYYRCLEKLSWATLGYFYDWTNRCYHEDDHHSGQQDPLVLLPPELVTLSRVFANISLGLEQANLNNQEASCQYNPSACIVNYYGSVIV
jgi:hypothetical protein